MQTYFPQPIEKQGNTITISLMNSFKNLYNAKASTEDVLTPAQYLRLSESERENIKSTCIIAPKLGGHDFGKIKVTRKTPVYVIAE